MFGFKKKQPQSGENVKFLPENINVEFNSGDTILDICIREDLPLSHSCGGMGSCGTCRVEITTKRELLDPRNEIESEWAEDRNFKENERLGCQCLAKNGLTILIPS